MDGKRRDIDPTIEAEEQNETEAEEALPVEIDRDGPPELPPEPNAVTRGREAILHFARLAPTSPGVYRMIDAKGDVLYVGKAKNLQKRVISYARGNGHTNRIARMIATTASMECISTATETEALLLEANLIRRFAPPFNVFLRDDKSFPYILLRTNHPAPQILKHRGARSLPGDYFGPFASPGAVNRTINALRARVPGALLLGRVLREPNAAVPAVPDQALLGALHRRDFARRLQQAGGRSARLPLGQEPQGAG